MQYLRIDQEVMLVSEMTYCVDGDVKPYSLSLTALTPSK